MRVLHCVKLRANHDHMAHRYQLNEAGWRSEVAYLKILDDDMANERVSVVRTVDVADALGPYVGPTLLLDFDADNRLRGIELLGSASAPAHAAHPVSGVAAALLAADFDLRGGDVVDWHGELNGECAIQIAYDEGRLQLSLEWKPAADGAAELRYWVTLAAYGRWATPLFCESTATTADVARLLRTAIATASDLIAAA